MNGIKKQHFSAVRYLSWEDNRMKKYDTPTLDVEWFTAQTALSQSTTDPDKENPGTEF